MARGPLPKTKKRRTNQPTIPTTELDVSGRKGRPPKVPGAYNLQKAGTEWWKWAWSTPQALAWDSGALYVIARRAQLEDDLALVDSPFEATDLAELLGVDEDEAIGKLEYIVNRLAALAGGRLPIVKEMRELDKRLGLDPKAMAELRWEIVDKSEAKADDSPAPGPASKKQKKADDRKARLSLVKSA